MLEAMKELTDDPATNPAASTFEVVAHPHTTTVMHLSGTLDRNSAAEMRSEFATAIAEGHQDLILDVRDVPTIDGAGANSLVYGMHRAQDAGGELRLVAPTDQVMQRLELGHHEIPSHATVVEALEAEAVLATHHLDVTMDAHIAEAVVNEVVADASLLTERQLGHLEAAVLTERRARSRKSPPVR